MKSFKQFNDISSSSKIPLMKKNRNIKINVLNKDSDTEEYKEVDDEEISIRQ